MELEVNGRSVATYVVEEPRPYLHPMRTLGGVVVTDVEPEDHKWHMGLSLAVQDVNGTNLWGGRTYVRGQGYTWLDDHGTMTHEGFDHADAGRIVQRLTWRDKDGKPLLHELRTITASAVDSASWALELKWALTAPERVVFGSPTTNGREWGAGYGGCFLRIAPGPSPVVTAGSLTGEDEVNGSDDPSLEWRSPEFRLHMTSGPRWFVRTSMYPGVCAAWAFDQVMVIEAGDTWEGAFRLVVSDVSS
ncbi:PmoA family protein [Allorhizocola rhizosphaerae]|uniref:DUF6807 domain-containing protein n=1 Tax=Allorhizocola rhizosphaerae TaxID=1872709 RepID=UPI001FE7B2FD|nr:PmoA family protein [Allorhizocola rhizosphaerae]